MVEYDARLHTREGFNSIKVKARDIVTGFIQERTFPITYKSDTRDLFQINKPQKSTETFIDNATAHSSYRVSFKLQATSSETLTLSTYLNS